MKVLEGHLTSLDKKVINQMILKGINVGGYKKTDYHLIKKENIYTCIQIKIEWDCNFMRNKKIKKKYISKFIK